MISCICFSWLWSFTPFDRPAFFWFKARTHERKFAPCFTTGKNSNYSFSFLGVCVFVCSAELFFYVVCLSLNAIWIRFHWQFQQQNAFSFPFDALLLLIANVKTIFQEIFLPQNTLQTTNPTKLQWNENDEEIHENLVVFKCVLPECERSSSSIVFLLVCLCSIFAVFVTFDHTGITENTRNGAAMAQNKQWHSLCYFVSTDKHFSWTLSNCIWYTRPIQKYSISICWK